MKILAIMLEGNISGFLVIIHNRIVVELAAVGYLVLDIPSWFCKPIKLVFALSSGYLSATTSSLLRAPVSSFVSLDFFSAVARSAAHRSPGHCNLSKHPRSLALAKPLTVSTRLGMRSHRFLSWTSICAHAFLTLAPSLTNLLMGGNCVNAHNKTPSF